VVCAHAFSVGGIWHSRFNSRNQQEAMAGLRLRHQWNSNIFDRSLVFNQLFCNPRQSLTTIKIFSSPLGVLDGKSGKKRIRRQETRIIVEGLILRALMTLAPASDLVVNLS